MYATPFQSARGYRNAYIHDLRIFYSQALLQPSRDASCAAVSPGQEDAFQASMGGRPEQETKTMVAPELLNSSGGFIWEDPAIIGVNKRAARTKLFNFSTASEAYKFVSSIGRKVGDKPPKGGRLLLNGDWRFKLFSCPTDIPEHFATGCIDDSWSKVRNVLATMTHGWLVI